MRGGLAFAAQILIFSVEDVEHEAELVVLLIGTLAGGVLVLVVGVELKVGADGEETAGVNGGVGPLGILALIEEFRTGVGRDVVAAEVEGALEQEPVAVAPVEAAVLPVEIETIAVA